MSNHTPVTVSRHDSMEGTFRAYVAGFVGSIILTVAAYLLVVQHAFARLTLVAVIIALALLQFLIQIVSFLHLGRETKPRWKLLVFVFMTGVIFILVFGSLWIMDNLNYRMTPAQVRAYLNNQTGF